MIADRVQLPPCTLSKVVRFAISCSGVGSTNVPPVVGGDLLDTRFQLAFVNPAIVALSG